jgi:FemAB-related protein (PEP-CTERM system-associated)
MKIEVCSTKEHEQSWRNFVDNHVHATGYHRWEWKTVVENSFGWPTFYLMASELEAVKGILPIVVQDSWVLGKSASSMPLLQGGGILATDSMAAEALLQRAIEVSTTVGAKYLELRYQSDPKLGLPMRTDKIRDVLTIDEDTERMFGALDSRLRTSIRKGTKAGLVADFGGRELLDDFYSVFARNMRDLGTPVYAKSFFENVIASLAPNVHICVVRDGIKPVASAFLIGYRDAIESAWASSIRESLPLKPNQFLHWSVVCFAARKDYRVLDFGRSSVGSGTHNYKAQWGSATLPLFWYYWAPNTGRSVAVDRHDPKFRFAIRAWQKLPLTIANWLGPTVVRHLPS